MSITEHPSFGRINTMTAAFVASVAAKQAEYFIANSKYFQGIKILGDGVQPDGTTDINMDATRKPSDQGESWSDFDSSTFKNNVKIPVQVSIDVFKAPDGWGWTMKIEVWKAGFGPDSYGSDGEHWMYRHEEKGGEVATGERLDEWYIMPEYTGP